MFSSGAHAKLNRPCTIGEHYGECGGYDRPLTNPVNPILQEIRDEIPVRPFDAAREVAWLNGPLGYPENYPPGAIEHARAVLSRLVAVHG